MTGYTLHVFLYTVSCWVTKKGLNVASYHVVVARLPMACAWSLC